MTRQPFRIDWPPRNLFLLIASTFGAFLALEGFLLRVFGDLPLTLTPWEVLFWTALLVWSIRVEVRLPLSASMSQLFLFALALVVLTRTLPTSPFRGKSPLAGAARIWYRG
ncbi:hypothetical protein [Thermus aquaticus]|uniref:hypothetical protein n=1 Tax=Thermus aquaticus TaxID=271 RepID=UPI0006B227AD|nr:hypothetical protein [Thermus aquaticus]